MTAQLIFQETHVLLAAWSPHQIHCRAKRPRRPHLPCKAFGTTEVQHLSESGSTSQILVVAGDVKEGSSVSCEGDICVLGRLSGKAHAGSKGDKSALVKALQICTDEIQIADKRVGEYVECDWPVLLSCNASGFLEMRCQGDAQESSGMQEPFALVTVPDKVVEDSQEELVSVSPSHKEVAVEINNVAVELNNVSTPVLAQEVEDSQLEDSPVSSTPEPSVIVVEPEPTEPIVEIQPISQPLAVWDGKREAGNGGLKKQSKKRRKFTWSSVKEAGPVAKLALFTGAYISAVGFALLVAPLKCFTLLFDQRSVAPVWIRIGGILAMLFGFYYVGAAHGDITRRGLKSFYEATVWGRLFLFTSFMILVAVKKSQWQLSFLAIVNLIGALSMKRALSLA